MTISGIESSFDVNSTQRTYGNRVLSKNFNIPVEEINSGSSFATVRSIEDIQKEWNDRIIEAAKNNKTSMRDVLKQNYPNAENMKWGFVGSDVEMTFDEFVKYMEDENRKWIQSNKDWLEEKGLWEYVK